MVIYFFIPVNLLFYLLMKQQQNRIVQFSEPDKMQELSGLKITIPVYGNDVTNDKPKHDNNYRNGPFNKRGGMKILLIMLFFFI